MGQIKNIKLHIVTDIKLSTSHITQLHNMATEIVRDEILDTEEMKKLYVRGIPKDATDEELKEFFETQSEGSVSEVAVIRKDGEQKNTFGFVTFAESELIDKLLLKRDGMKFKENELSMNRAVPKNANAPGAHERTKKLFIANVPKTGVTEDDLMKYFKERQAEEYGTIESVELIKKKDDEGNKTEENKGFGFVTVSSEDMADKMCIQHASFEFGGRKIELKKSSPPNKEGVRGGRGGRGRGRGQFAGGYGGGYGGYGGGYGAYSGYAGGYGGGYGQRYSP